jgi:hypothetical protein
VTPPRSTGSRPGGGVAGCLSTETGSETGAATGTTALDSDDATRSATPQTTTPPGDGPGRLRIENTTRHLIDVRIQILRADGPESLLGYFLVEAESTRVVPCGVERTGTHHLVATLPTPGDRDVDWTVDDQWSIASTAAPGTVTVSVAEEGLPVETPTR